jgi:hypothetical protein
MLLAQRAGQVSSALQSTMTQSTRNSEEIAGSGKRPGYQVTRGPRAPKCPRPPVNGTAVFDCSCGSYRVLVPRAFPPQMLQFWHMPLGNGKTAQKLHRQKPKLLQIAWAQRDLNPRPSDYESPALTAELWAQHQTSGITDEASDNSFLIFLCRFYVLKTCWRVCLSHSRFRKTALAKDAL